MTSEAAHDALDVDRRDRDRDAEQTADPEDAWKPGWAFTYDHRTYDPFVED